MIDDTNAFCQHAHPRRTGRSAGPLTGLTFAAKDIIEVEGVTACFGNPTWLQTHPPATRDARSISLLLDAGANLDGVTVTDELALSLTGENPHYGTPLNSLAPNRVPGGSSSGSASAVAAGVVDFALGTDTAGSVRVPASNCGVYGIRTSLGAVGTDGIIPLAQCFDTVGWFTRDAELLATVGGVLLESDTMPGEPFKRFIVIPDMSAPMDDGAWSLFRAAASSIADALHFPLADCAVGPPAPKFQRWPAAYAALQTDGILTEHRAFLDSDPSFGSLVGRRIEHIRDTTVDVARAARARGALRDWLAQVFAAGACVLLPSAPGAAPVKGQSDDDVDLYTGRLLMLTSLASLCGAPQISMPLCRADGSPFGLSLLGPAGSDATLLDLAVTIADLTTQEPSPEATAHPPAES
jgi:amidase